MRKFLLCFLAFAGTPFLRAQAIEVYGTFVNIHATNVPATSTLLCPGIACPIVSYRTTTSGDVGTAGGGVTLNLLRLPVVKLGIDVRGSRHFGSTGVDTVLGGLKLTIHPPFLNVRPYIQGSAGYLGTVAGVHGDSAVAQNMTTARYAAAEVLVGLDLPLIRILDLRVLEIGAGHALNSVDSTKPTFVTASTGLVLHF